MLGLGTSINKSSSSESASIAARSSSFTGLLDESYGGSASAAYSVRRLSSSYSGKALQIRRVSDNVEVDVSFDNNNEISLDSAVTNVTEETTGSSTSIITRAVNLGEFVANASYTDADSLGSTDSAKVQCWYDQSGNSNDTTQNTAGNQPTIVSSGALVTENGKPALEFDGSDDALNSTSNVSMPLNNAIAIVAKGISTVTDEVFNINGTSGLNIRIQSNNVRLLYTDSDQNNVASASNNQFLLYAGRQSTTNTVYGSLDGGAQLADTSLDSSSWNTATGTLHVGARGGTSLEWDGKVQEVIYYASDESDNRTNIENNINAFYSIF